MAILRLFIDSGVRRAELAHLNVSTRTSSSCSARDGARERVRSDEKTAIALDRYLRARATHKAAHLDALWLGQRAPVTDSGISQIVEKRGLAAGIERLHPQQLRHTFASDWLAQGGTETDLMRLAGWRSRAMLQHCAQTTRARRSLLTLSQ